MSKKTKIYLIIIISLILIFIYTTFNKTIYSDKFYSPTNKNFISIKAKYATLFGPSSIKIYCRNNKVLGIFNQEIINTKIYNDGGAIDESNFYVKWDDDYNVTITISGDEQKDEIFEVKFSEDIFIRNIHYLTIS